MAESDTNLLTETDNSEQVTHDWHTDVPEEYKEKVTQKGWDGHAAVYKSYFELEQSAGSKVKLPTPESSAEEVSAFYDRIGRPANAEGYELPRPDMPEGMTYNENFEKAITAIAYEEGISKQQLQALSKAFNEYQMSEFTNFQAELQRTHEEGERTLKEKWGTNYDKNLEVARRACKELGSDEFNALLDASKLGNNPIFIEAFHNIGTKILNDTLIQGTGVKGEDKEYVPAYKDSPSMYRNDETEEGKKARAWFNARGMEV